MTESRTKLPTLLAVAVVIAAAGLVFAGPISGRDEPRWVRLSVEWTPSPRADPISITWMVNGMPGAPVPAIYQSPWPPRDIAIHRGETLVLHAMQKTAGQLTCAIFERGQPIADDVATQAGGIVECVAIG